MENSNKNEDLRDINPCIEDKINELAPREEPEQIDWETKYALLTKNLESAYAKIRQLEKQLSDRTLKERSSDMLISQAVSVLSNTVMLAIKNKEN